MKKLLLYLIVVCLVQFLALSQIKLVGTGENSVFAINPDGNEPEKWVDFSFPKRSFGNLTLFNGKIWGTTEAGGPFDAGTIFNMDIDGTNLQALYNFDNTNGANPRGTLIVSDGKLWGTAFSGGANGDGVLFSIESDGTFTRIHDFDGTGGSDPIYNLTEINGVLWGMTPNGGTTGNGVIFSVDTDGTNYSVLHHFDGTNGGSPNGGLTLSNGKVWGTTNSGGASFDGVIFSIDPDGTNFTKVHDFDDTNGRETQHSSLVESNGKLWGVTQRGGSLDNGVIFSLNNDGTGFTKLHDFEGITGTRPYGGLIENTGKLWGMTYSGGTSGGGTIYTIDNDGTNFTKVHDFVSQTGRLPWAELTLISGEFWGTTISGGVTNDGTIFTINTDGTDYTLINSFINPQGSGPSGDLIESNDRLWGMTAEGGASGYGIVFSTKKDGSDFTIIHEFDQTMGASPVGSLIESNGKLWGMTYDGGLNDDGTIFTIDLDGSNFTKVHDFLEANGGSPGFLSSLVESNNKLWGVTESGGSFSNGVIFTIDLNGSNYAVVHEFDNTNGRNPYYGMLESNGKLWGMTPFGGANGDGIIYTIDPDGTNFTNVHNFDKDVNGSDPDGGFTEFNGKLWGVTTEGGSEGGGVIFSIGLDGTNLSVVHEFDGTNGERPIGSLFEFDGKLLGMTKNGGDEDSGVIYAYDEAAIGSEFSIIREFTGEFGRAPISSLIAANTDIVAPSFSSAFSLNVEENMVGNVYTIATNEPATYSLGDSNDEALFTLTTDAIRFTSSPDFENPLDADGNNIYLVGITATDEAGNSSSIIITITVTNANEGSEAQGSQIKLVGTGENSVFAINPDGSEPEKWFDFTAPETPASSLVEINGKLWGTSQTGGSYSRGTIFYVDPDGSNLTKVHDFDETNGQTPRGDLIAAGGKIWGTTNSGGADNNGIIFSIDLNGANFTVVHEFDDTNGKNPADNLTLSNGKLWGMTSSGGTSNRGVIFTLNTDGTNYTKVHDFDNTNGSSPLGYLVESGGKLWGVTFNGGSQGRGIIFSIDTDGTNFTKHHDFTNADGSNPRGSMMASGDKLFGLVTSGGSFSDGIIYRINNDGTNFTKIHDFDDTNGKGPYGNLIEYNGLLWGMTRNGGSDSRGVIFSIKPDGTEFTNHFDFQNDVTNGRYPEGDLVVINGSFVGMTIDEGFHGEGIIFTLDLDGTNFTKVHDLGSQYGRAAPQHLSQHNDKIWGMNPRGGESRDGLIFTMDRDGGNFTKVHDFDDNNVENGGDPHGFLVESNDRLWGMTADGGENGDGVVFSTNMQGGDYTKAADLEYTAPGEPSDPYGSLLASNGKLWGVRSQNGTSGDGVIFTVDNDGSNYTEIHDFDGTNGSFPLGTMVESNGKIWGVTEGGGTSDYGIIFNINPDGTNFTKVHDFDESNGSYPVSIMTLNDKLYGLAAEGGSFGYGVMFSIDSDGTNFTVVHEFNESNGSYPYGGLTDYEDKLWGMTSQGGTSEFGVIFNYDASNSGSEFSVTYNFTGEFASNPEGSLIFVNTDVTDPIFTSSTSASIVENTSGTVYTITTDEAASYTLGDENDEALFTLDLDEIRFSNAPDFETPLDDDTDNNYVIEIIATDEAGNSSTQVVTITVTDENENNAPTVVASIADLNEETGFNPIVIDLGDVFGDIDGDNLAFNAVSSNTNVATVSIQNQEELLVSEVGIGSSTILVTADDGNGGSVFDEFIITITEAPLGFTNLELSIYPNPTIDFIHINADKELNISLINLRGQVLQSTNGKVVQMDVRSLSAGTYLLKCTDGESSTTRRIIKAN